MSARQQGLFGLDGGSHECVHWVSDHATGLRAIIAIHNTARGPAFGGCRMRRYASEEEALSDALRLSQGMSLKNALADLPFGGGKAVIMAPAGDFDRQALFTAFGRAVDGLGGRYITAEDVGTTTDDMKTLRRVTAHVSGIPRTDAFGGDPSPKTALGVFVSIEEAVRRHLKRPGLAGTTVAVQGLGAVGAHLCGLLHQAGAQLLVADVNAARVLDMQARFGATPVPVEEVCALKVDVLAPCALGAVIDEGSIPRLQAQIVAGAANNQLATPADGKRIHQRGILYLPD
ncbi:MAG: Glu/Leu/Phe/Val dehydrogenase, partial [Haliea sp.]